MFSEIESAGLGYSLLRNSRHRIYCYGGNHKNIFLQEVELNKKLIDEKYLSVQA